MDSLSALGVFVRAAEARSFTDAGRRLSVSSSAVGKTISRLEDRLGVRLFHRNTRAITLTPEGELFLESCRRIFSEINKIELEFSQSKSTPKGRLKVSLPDVGMLMMPTLHGFMREYPEIQVDAEFTDNVVDVIDGGYDAVIRSGEQTELAPYVAAAWQLPLGDRRFASVLRAARHSCHARRPEIARVSAPPLSIVRQAPALALREVWALRRY